MNRRTLKKHCARARESLIREHGYRPENFVRSKGDETIDAPPAMERSFVQRGFLEPGPLRGTWLLFQRTSYEYDEWDYSLPNEVLGEITHWENISDEDVAQHFLAEEPGNG